MRLPPRSEWPPGPWHNEPDREDWIDENTGYPCIVARHEFFGTWRGYVGIPESHPCADLRVERRLFNVHGQITWVGDFVMLDPAPEGGFWLGFDCAHADDLMPLLVVDSALRADIDHLDDLRADYPDWPKPVYRTFDFAREQCRYLAAQLKGRESARPPATHGPDG